MVQETISPAAIADEKEGCQENQGTYCARFPFQEEAEQVEAHEHGVAEPQDTMGLVLCHRVVRKGSVSSLTSCCY